MQYNDASDYDEMELQDAILDGPLWEDTVDPEIILQFKENLFFEYYYASDTE